MDVPTRPTPPQIPPPNTPARPALRLFLHESGWTVGLKIGSERVFCYVMAPGQDYYHRLLDGELYLASNDERICFACAERRGLIGFEPRTLREPFSAIDLTATPPVEAIPLKGEEPDDADATP